MGFYSFLIQFFVKMSPDTTHKSDVFQLDKKVFKKMLLTYG